MSLILAPTISAYKTHTNGNDFLLIDTEVNHDISVQTVQKIADRKRGIGCDQVITYQYKENISSCQFFNQDGSSAELCLNGIYALANHLKKMNIHCNHIQTKHQSFSITDNNEDGLRVSIPQSILQSIKPYTPYPQADIPHIIDCDLVDIGNPHLLITIENIDDFPLSLFATHPSIKTAFPKGINISIYSILSGNSLRMRTYERGVGYTQGCGSAGLASFFRQKSKDNNLQILTVYQPGGDIIFQSGTNQVIMKAACATVGRVEINRSI
tara:strand:+ start:307 stop:1113 length:807 start_codon:yes stop_codon:yes gene_type:complete